MRELTDDTIRQWLHGTADSLTVGDARLEAFDSGRRRRRPGYGVITALGATAIIVGVALAVERGNSPSTHAQVLGATPTASQATQSQLGAVAIPSTWQIMSFGSGSTVTSLTGAQQPQLTLDANSATLTFDGLSYYGSASYSQDGMTIHLKTLTTGSLGDDGAQIMALVSTLNEHLTVETNGSTLTLRNASGNIVTCQRAGVAGG